MDPGTRRLAPNLYSLVGSTTERSGTDASLGDTPVFTRGAPFFLPVIIDPNPVTCEVRPLTNFPVAVVFGVFDEHQVTHGRVSGSG